MNDSELIALAAVVNAEALLHSVANQDRLREGFVLAYPDTSIAFDKLYSELQNRGVIPG